MTNTDPGAPEYEYDWQNPDQKTFDFGRTFNRAIEIIKLRGVRMLILTAIFLGLPFFFMNLLPMFMDGGLQDFLESEDPSTLFDASIASFIVMGVLIGLFFLIASLWLQPALIKISYSALTNEDEPIWPTLKQVSRFVLPVLGFYILYGLGVFFGFILLIIPAFFIGLGWMLGAHIIVLEGQGVTDSLSRSWIMSKGFKRWLLLLAIVFGIISTIISVLVSIPIYFMGDPNLALLEGASPLYWIMNGVLSAVAQAVASVIGMAWSTAAYVEIRKVREGVDPESKIDVFI